MNTFYKYGTFISKAENKGRGLVLTFFVFFLQNCSLSLFSFIYTHVHTYTHIKSLTLQQVCFIEYVLKTGATLFKPTISYKPFSDLT